MRIICKMYLAEIRLKDMNCIYLAPQRAYVTIVMNLQVI